MELRSILFLRFLFLSLKIVFNCLQNRIRELTGNILVLESHYTFFVCAEAQKVYASVPDDGLVYDGKLLMKIGSVAYSYAVFLKQFCACHYDCPIRFLKIFGRTCYDYYGNATFNNRFQHFDYFRNSTFSHKRAYN